MKVFVVGLGNWGTALANHLARKGVNVTGWAREAEIVESVNTTHRNCLFLTDVDLNPNLKATTDLSQSQYADLVLLALPSFALDEMVPKIILSNHAIVLSVIKGLEMERQMTPLQFCEARMTGRHPLVVLSGPSFARDVVVGKPCGVVAASKSEQAARTVAELFASEAMRVYFSTDPLGVELGGILKNVIVIAVGISDGLALGDSARAGLITRGLAEMMRLATKMGADRQTLAGLSGLGDLAMTATSDLSRNRQVGLRLGRGEKLDHILATLGSVAEGVRTAPLVWELAKKYGIEMTITSGVVRLLRGEITPQQGVRELFNKPVRAEFE